MSDEPEKHDLIAAVKLDDDALCEALDAAQDAFTAGGEADEQLQAGIKAYLWAMKVKGYQLAAVS